MIDLQLFNSITTVITVLWFIGWTQTVFIQISKVILVKTFVDILAIKPSCSMFRKPHMYRCHFPSECTLIRPSAKKNHYLLVKMFYRKYSRDGIIMLAFDRILTDNTVILLSYWSSSCMNFRKVDYYTSLNCFLKTNEIGMMNDLYCKILPCTEYP